MNRYMMNGQGLSNYSSSSSSSSSSSKHSQEEEEHEDDMMNITLMEDLRRGPWTEEEDQALSSYIAKHGEGRWNSLARCAGLNRTGKSCRLRWLNYLRPDVRRGNITLEEQLLILELHTRWGNRWSKIAKYLPGRTDNEIKNYWRTRVQKHAKQLKCDVNSQQFKDTMRYLWMPRLVERIQAATSTTDQTDNINFHDATDQTHHQYASAANNSSSMGGGYESHYNDPFSNQVSPAGSDRRRIDDDKLILPLGHTIQNRGLLIDDPTGYNNNNNVYGQGQMGLGGGVDYQAVEHPNNNNINHYTTDEWMKAMMMENGQEYDKLWNNIDDFWINNSQQQNQQQQFDREQ